MNMLSSAGQESEACENITFIEEELKCRVVPYSGIK